MFHMACVVNAATGAPTQLRFSAMGTHTHTANSGIYVLPFSTAHPLGTGYGVAIALASGTNGGQVSYTINSSSSITVYTFNKAGTATDYAFTLHTIP
jgi:hypothetical protein